MKNDDGYLCLGRVCDHVLCSLDVDIFFAKLCSFFNFLVFLHRYFFPGMI